MKIKENTNLKMIKKKVRILVKKKKMFFMTRKKMIINLNIQKKFKIKKNILDILIKIYPIIQVIIETLQKNKLMN